MICYWYSTEQLKSGTHNMDRVSVTITINDTDYLISTAIFMGHFAGRKDPFYLGKYYN
jgi:hypothetical protein